jgi:transposase
VLADVEASHAWAPYSLDLRKRVVAAVAGGMSRAEAARRFAVSHSSAIRWTKRATETGSPAALPMGGKKPFALADEAQWIRARLAEKPDITGRELLAELMKRGVTVSYYGVWHFLDPWVSALKKACAQANRIAPTLRAGDIVVMDNFSSYKDPAIRRAIRSAGGKLFHLPPYSPDLNPIEQAFSKLKTLLRKENARSPEQVERSIAALLTRLTPTECRNFFSAAGYAST